MTKIKICGLTQECEADYLNEAGVDFAGFIQFFPKSKRNIPLEDAIRIKARLAASIKSVAVTVSPTIQELAAIETAGFDYVQIHGNLPEDVLSRLSIPVIKAFNVSDLDTFEQFLQYPCIKGFVFDAQVPGSGKTFDWSLIPSLPQSDRFILLAGGLNPSNVAQAIAYTHAAGVDTSSGVENDNGVGKSRNKILEFVHNARYTVSG
jgi:phosphoribosylanthranilate isomerase